MKYGWCLAICICIMFRSSVVQEQNKLGVAPPLATRVQPLDVDDRSKWLLFFCYHSIDSVRLHYRRRCCHPFCVHRKESQRHFCCLAWTTAEADLGCWQLPRPRDRPICHHLVFLLLLLQDSQDSRKNPRHPRRSRIVVAQYQDQFWGAKSVRRIRHPDSFKGKKWY